MKNNKLFKLISLPVLTSGIVIPIATLSSCKTKSEEDKKPEPESTLTQFNYSKVASRNDLYDVKAPVTIANNSKHPFRFTISMPKEGHSIPVEDWRMQYRYSYSAGENWSEWTNIDVTEGGASFEFGGSSFLQLRVGLEDAAKVGTLSESEATIGFEFSTIGSEAIEPGEGITLGGSAMSLLCNVTNFGTYEEKWQGTNVLTTSHCFENVFAGSLLITEVTPQFLPFKTLTESCYAGMFSSCGNMMVAPELPATDLAKGCYSSMFYGCKRLTNAPYLPARLLKENCYASMFDSCDVMSYVNLAYVGNFTSKYFDNWLGNTTRNGTIVYSGLDTTTGVDAIPANFNKKIDTTISSNTKTITVKGDGESSLAKENNKIRFYKDQKFSEVVDQLKDVQYAIDPNDTFTHWAKKSGSTFEKLENIDDLLIGDSKIPTTIYPRYGFRPQIVKTSLNMITRAATSVTIKLASGAQLWYKDVTGENAWKQVTASTTIAFDSKHQILFRGKTGSNSLTNYTNIKITSGSVELDGSVMGLLAGADGAAHPTSVSNFCFYNLFAGSTGIKSVSDNFLYYTDTNGNYKPIKSLASTGTLCYGSMFEGCTNLTKAPELPATAIGQGSYYSMFKNCTKLEEFGEICATSCAAAYVSGSNYYGGFESMFEECKNLKSLETSTELANRKGLQVTTGLKGMYHKMFYNSGLVEAPNIALTSLEDGVLSVAGKGEGGNASHYGVCTHMFQYCTYMTTGPASISASKAGKASLRYMFANCVKLTKTPTWSFTSLGECSLEYMFYKCSQLKTCQSDFTSCTSWGGYCLASTFQSCGSLTRLPKFGDREVGNATSMFKWTFKGCNAVKICCYRERSTPSGYTHFFTWAKQVRDYDLSACKDRALGMLNVTYHQDFDDSATWSHTATDTEAGTPDYTGWSSTGPWKYGYKVV